MKTKVCACSCNHTYQEKTIGYILQADNNHMVGLVCSTCGDILRQWVASPTPVKTRNLDYMIPEFRKRMG